MADDAHLISQLWLNGRAVPADGARLVLDEHGTRWRLEADLGARSPFRQEYGLSVQLADGRIAHGRARIATAVGARVVFEGTGSLTGTVASSTAPPEPPRPPAP